MRSRAFPSDKGVLLTNEQRVSSDKGVLLTNEQRVGSPDVTRRRRLRNNADSADAVALELS